MAKPFIRKAGFWADGINGLLLRKPFRTYTKAAAFQEVPEQVQPAPPALPAPESQPRSSDPDARGSRVSQSMKSTQRSSTAEAAGQGSYTRWSDHSYFGGGTAANDLRNHLRSILASSYGEISTGTVPPGFPGKLRQRAEMLPELAEFTVAIESLPAYLSESMHPDALFNRKRLESMGFKGNDAAILSGVVEGLPPEIIVGEYAQGASIERVQEVVDRAYDMFGVRTPQGIHAAVCWLAAKESEAIAHNVRLKFEREVMASQADSDVTREERPTASPGIDWEPNPWDGNESR